jgi:hypothetical protein
MALTDVLKQLAEVSPAIVAGLRGNPEAMKAFMDSFQQTNAQLDRQEALKQQTALQGQDRQLALEDRTRGIERQGVLDAEHTADRTRAATVAKQGDALRSLEIAPRLAELGSTGDTPADAQRIIESAIPTLMSAFGPETMAMGMPAVEMATRTITGRQKKQVEAFVDAALKTAYVADNPDADPEMTQLPDHIVKILGKPTAKLSELQQFAQLPVGKPQGKTRTPAAVGSFEDFVARAYGDAPTPEQILKARKAYNQSDDKPGAPVDPEIAALRKDLLRMQVERAGETKEPNQTQFTSAGYAGRMEQAEPILTAVAPTIVGMGLPSYEMQTNSWFAKPTFQSKDVQSYMQAARNFINAVLRRESGAVISPSEFAEAKQQYLPQPGDTPEALQQKADNRAYVFQTMKRSAGRAYEPPVKPPSADTGGQFIVAKDAQGNIHHAPAGTPLPAGWTLVK